MDKQELLKTLEEWKKYRNSQNHELQYYQLAEVINLVEQLDEPQKIKVPAYVEEHIEYSDSANWSLLESIQEMNGNVGSRELANWFEAHSEDYARAWLDGYEVEEEPKWVVKVGNLYFCGWEDTTAQFVMNTVLGEDESIIKYKNEGTASSVAKNLGGTVEKV